MSMPDLSIQQAFLDGINEVFSTMFTESVKLYLMDEESTKVNVYDETEKKAYLEVCDLIAKVTTTFTEGELPVEDIKVDAVFTIPTKQLIINNLSRETMDDLKNLSKGKISYRGIDYLIHRVVPKTLVADEWQMYDFICYIEKSAV